MKGRGYINNNTLVCVCHDLFGLCDSRLLPPQLATLEDICYRSFLHVQVPGPDSNKTNNKLSVRQCASFLHHWDHLLAVLLWWFNSLVSLRNEIFLKTMLGHDGNIRDDYAKFYGHH